ncbi:MAG TPA: glycoside hydrolase family 1 protein [Candidatus Binatia bacterium]|nr:glycoside hydrolase family 1 protein [Candidatus Binatia bacterium]
MARELRFPDGFLFGAATAAHQVEGGCLSNQWSAWEHEGDHIRDGSTADLACDHYRRFREDFALARDLGHDAHRFSIEWSRLEPEEGAFDEREADHYRAVLDAIREHGMEPLPTLHHFTNPLWVQRQGGWENPRVVDWLAGFAGRAARAFGDRVRIWWTINEPMVAPALCYLMGIHPPAVRDLTRALPVARHVLLAHGAMYRAIKEAAPHAPAVGPVLQMPYIAPLDPSSDVDRAAAAQQDFLFNEYYLQGLVRGVVSPPIGGGEEIPGLAGSYDVVGLNYYARMLVSGTGAQDLVHPAGGAGSGDGGEGEMPLMGARRRDEPPEFHDQMGWEVYPPGLHAQLVRLKALGKPLYVTENGMATRDERARCRHLLAHLAQVHRAIEDGADVRGFLYWTLMDNFEWAEGYTKTFGLVEVDRARDLARRPREAAYLFRDVARAKAIGRDVFDRYGVAVA